MLPWIANIARRPAPEVKPPPETPKPPPGPSVGMVLARLIRDTSSGGR